MSFIRHILKAIRAQGDELGFPEASEGVPTGTGGSSGEPMPHFNEGGKVYAKTRTQKAIGGITSAIARGGARKSIDDLIEGAAENSAEVRGFASGSREIKTDDAIFKKQGDVDIFPEVFQEKSAVTLGEAKDALEDLREEYADLLQRYNNDDLTVSEDELMFYERLIDDLEIDIIKFASGEPDDYIVRGMMAEGGPIDAQMNELMPPVEEEQEMLPDEEMEDDYIDFIMDEALNEEEKDMLMSKLEQDNELQMLFDKVLDVAQEFAGSGPVEGPGSGISDSIPARLSDGEFVMTAKAADQLGPENLQALMERAEQVHDMDRNAMKNGGSAILNEDSEVSARESVGKTTVKEELMKRSLTNTEGAHIHS